MKSCKSHEVTIVMGDFNAKVGEGKEGRTGGPHGLGERNDLFILNTWFNVHPRRRYTRTSPGDRARNQIDYIVVIQNCCQEFPLLAYPGADEDSDPQPGGLEVQIIPHASRKTYT